MADAPTDTERPTRDRILDAAEAIVENEGARRLTIDAVVRESGLSKGGVLYHFASKLALIEGMVQRMVATVEADLAEARASAEAKGEPVLPAVIHVILHHRKKNSRVSMGVLAAAAENPELLDPVRDFLTRVRQQILDHAVDPDLARIVLLAADGLHFADILGLDFLTPDERRAAEARLVRLVSENDR